MAVPSGWVVTAMWHLYPCQGQMAFSKHVERALRTIWPNCHKIVLPVHAKCLPCIHLYLTWCYQSCLWDDSSHCLTYTFPTSPCFRSKPVYVCLCCGMKGSIVRKRCVWNPCCLVGVRGRYVKKRTPFYSWHGSVWNATLGRAAPLPVSVALPPKSLTFLVLSRSLSAPLSFTPWRSVATGQDSWVFGPVWCLFLVLFGTIRVKMLPSDASFHS